MEVQTTYDLDGTPRKNYIFEPGERAVMTGPVTGIVELSSGKTVNLGEDYVLVADEAEFAELNDAIGQIHLDNGHPDDVDVLTNPETGEQVLVQRPFVHINADGESVTGVGTPVGEHPLEVAEAKAEATNSKGN